MSGPPAATKLDPTCKPTNRGSSTQNFPLSTRELPETTNAIIGPNYDSCPWPVSRCNAASTPSRVRYLIKDCEIGVWLAQVVRSVSPSDHRSGREEGRKQRLDGVSKGSNPIEREVRMRLLHRGRHMPIIGWSHSSRRFHAASGPFYSYDPPAHSPTITPTPIRCPTSRPAAHATTDPTASIAVPLIIFDSPATTLLDGSRTDHPLPPLLHSNHLFASQPRGLRLRRLRSSPRSGLSVCDPRATPSAHRTLSTMAQPEWTGVRVRNTFFEFFEKKGHTVVPSSSVVPHNDPTLRKS
jgi:hypothetical protein